MSFRVEPLGGDDARLSGFSCGDERLDRWLRDHATNARGQGTRTFLLIEDDGAVAGYFALAPHAIARDTVPATVGRGSPDPIPGYLIAKLALDQRHQGQGLGSELLIACLAGIISAARTGGGKLIVVDAISDAAADFYRRHDFIDAGHRRLVMKISTAANALKLPWP